MAYTDLTARVVEVLPPEIRVDAVGFSLGALTLLELACREPERFGRIVLAGIGQNVFARQTDQVRRIVDGVRGVRRTATSRPRRSATTPSSRATTRRHWRRSWSARWCR